MKKNELYEITIEDISTDGEGIGHIAPEGHSTDSAAKDGKGIAVFVKDTVMGDVIQVRITKVKKNYAYGRLEKLLTPSGDRVEPRCEKARSCGGCTLMHMSYARQLDYKWNTVRNCLTRIGGLSGIESVMEPICGMQEPYYYRNKMQFPVGLDRNGNVQIGFYAGHTHSIVDLARCEIGHPVNNYILKSIRPCIQAWQEQYRNVIYDEETHTGLLRHILIRVGYTTGEVMVCLVINGKSLPKSDCTQTLVHTLQQAVADYNEEQPAVKCSLTSVSLNINRDKTNRILGDRCMTIYGNDYITDYIGDIQFRISPMSFYQVNPVQTKVLYDKAVVFAGLTGQETVWDLYCGIGTISLSLAGRAGKVYGVEIVPQAIEDAKKNAEINNIDNAEFFCGKAEEIAPKLCTPDVIVVDPPRKGCDEALLETILRVLPERIVYVSCNPATLARDLKILTERAYEVKKVGVVDQFAHSGHVECVAKLHRVNS